MIEVATLRNRKQGSIEDNGLQDDGQEGQRREMKTETEMDRQE